MEIRALLDRMDHDGWKTEVEDFAREQGITTFGRLVELLTSSEDSAVLRQGYRVFSLVSADDEVYLGLLGHPHHGIRRAAASMFRGETALRYSRELLPLLADEDHYAQREALWAFGTMGPEVLPLLQETRRTAKGALRRGALIGIVEVGGPDAFVPEDRAVVDRFIRYKLEDDMYSIDEMHLCGGWYAIKTDDQAAVLGVCGLHDPVPVTKVLGADAWNNDHHAWSKDDEHVRCARVYVTGAWDGWTLVFGEPFEHGTRSVQEICAVLSAVFGETHYYGESCGDGWTAWCVAKDGEIVRYYDAFKEDEQIGELDVEDGWCLPHDLSDENDDLDDIYATDVAEELSVNPRYFEGDTEGHGVLALTQCGRTYGSPKGFLRVSS
ncbi:HEAT repeat domain-containing protein [Lentzea sp. NPDC058436]|uniref:HEAT repeat domain-containing protein n=1 Tax=Lentzea sp. NPDC058436 TaxID=3346499 RepID=UPI0036534996